MEVHVVYNKHTAIATITRQCRSLLMHTTLMRDSKQAMPTTSTLLRYTIVVASDIDGDVVAVAAIQGPSSVMYHLLPAYCSDYNKRLLHISH